MTFTPRIERAIRISALAHRNQTRKGGNVPYIIHPFSVMTIAAEATDDEDTLIACLFHDILEDVPEEYPESVMREEFGDRVVGIVRGVTKNDDIHDWHEQCRDYLRNLHDNAPDESVVVSAADKIHNLMSVIADHEVMGDEVWQKFTVKNADDQLWWYESVLDTIKKRQAPPRLINKLAGLIVELREQLGRAGHI